MAIKLTDKIHTVSTDIDTKNRGSAQANAGRDAYTLQEVKDVIGAGGGVTQITAGTNVTISPTDGLGNVTVNSTGGGGGGIGGSITAGQIAFGDTTADEITGDDDFKISGDTLFIPRMIAHTGDEQTKFGFLNNSGDFQVQIFGSTFLQVTTSSVKLNNSGFTCLKTLGVSGVGLGVEVTGQMNLKALNTAPAANNSAGTLGEIRWTEGFVYICTLTGANGAANWNRATLTSGW